MSSLEDDPETEAAKKGLSVRLPEENQLFIDLDDESNRRLLMQGIELFARNNICLEIEKETVSSCGNRHVYLRVYGQTYSRYTSALGNMNPRTPRVLEPMERILLQALLGSAPAREALSLLRIWGAMARPPTVLFEVPEGPELG